MMGKVTEGFVQNLKSAGVDVLEAHIHPKGGHVAVNDVVHCCNGGGKEWRENRRLVLRSNAEVARYLDDIS